MVWSQLCEAPLPERRRSRDHPRGKSLLAKLRLDDWTSSLVASWSPVLVCFLAYTGLVPSALIHLCNLRLRALL